MVFPGPVPDTDEIDAGSGGRVKPGEKGKLFMTGKNDSFTFDGLTLESKAMYWFVSTSQ